MNTSIYTISADEKEPKRLQLTYTFFPKKLGKQSILLPIWRPGRYQAQHFAKNIDQVIAKSASGNSIEIFKSEPSVWNLLAEDLEPITLHYSYWAEQADAGGSVSTSEMLYINFINCCLFLKGTENQACEVRIDCLDFWQKATALKNLNSFTWRAKSYRELVDSPFMAAPQIASAKWKVGDVTFYAQGIVPQGFFTQKLLSAYQKISEFQLDWMKDFPVKNYRFLHWICPQPFYHGVEHINSTMMVMGPEDRDAYEDLIGLASHELFHVWNIGTIRPKELLPYAYHKEVYFTTGGIVEGITTYLGDWFLYASGVWNREEYVASLLGNLKLHFDRDGDSKQSLVESSIDLWMDGYGKSLPSKRVSIYYKGALFALGLDLMIRRKFEDQKSIREVMLLMNQRFGRLKRGYTLEDFYAICEEVYEGSLRDFFQKWMEGNDCLLDETNELLGERYEECRVVR
ncbi:M61 family metallopeptidase [Aquirufa sp. ROCK-SH2]